MSSRKAPSAKCRHCGKIVRVRPSGGDWLNAIYPIRHKDKNGNPCRGWTREVQTSELIEPNRNPQ